MFTFCSNEVTSPAQTTSWCIPFDSVLQRFPPVSSFFVSMWQICEKCLNCYNKFYTNETLQAMENISSNHYCVRINKALNISPTWFNMKHGSHWQKSLKSKNIYDTENVGSCLPDGISVFIGTEVKWELIAFFEWNLQEIHITKSHISSHYVFQSIITLTQSFVYVGLDWSPCVLVLITTVT
jgi:hypothetical protein